MVKQSGGRSSAKFKARMGGLGLALLASTSMSLTVVATAQKALAQQASAATDYAVPAGPLGSAISRFGDRANLQVLYPADMVRGKTSPGISGNLTREAALDRLLAGTGLSWRFTAANTVTIVDASAAAVGAGAAADGSTMLDTITVSGKSGRVSADEPYRTAGSSSYISGEKIERFRGTSTGDMLSGTPGVLNADNRNGAALDVNIRGMQGQGRVPVVVDGAQQENTVWRGYAGISGRSYVDPDLIGGVMVEKGPGGAVDTPGAIGGVVRMNTISVDDILLPDRNFGVRLKGGFNSNSSSMPALLTQGGYWGATSYATASLPSSFGGSDGMDRPGFLKPTGGSGSITAAYRSEFFDTVAAYARRKNGNYHAGTNGSGIPNVIVVPDCRTLSSVDFSCTRPQAGRTVVGIDGLSRFRAGEEILNTSQDNTSFLWKGTLRLPHDQTIDLSYMRYESDYGELMPSQIVPLASQGPFQATLYGIDMNTYNVKYSWNPAGNDLIDLSVRLWMTDADMRAPLQYYLPNIADYANLYGQDSKRRGVNVENKSVFDAGTGSVTLKYGGSFTYETIKPGDGAHPDSTRNGNRRELGLFLSGAWKPTDWLTLDTSVRYSDFKTEDRPLHSAAIGDMDHRGSGFAPTIGAMVEPWQGIQFYGKYAEAIRLPSLFETAVGFSTDFLLSGLDPERAKSWEFGFNVLRDDVFTDGDSLRFKANYFDNRIDDYLTRVEMDGGRTPIANIDYAQFRGIELSASYDAGRFFGDLSYTRYTDTNFCMKQVSSSNPTYSALCYEGGVPNSYVVNHLPPRDSLSLTVGARAFEEKLTIGSRMTYTGKRPVSGLFGDADLTGYTIAHVEWKPYTLVDVFANYKVNDRFQLSAAVDNVMDVYYVDTLSLGKMPSPGRTFRLNMTAKF